MLSRTAILLSVSHIDWGAVWLCKELLKKEKVWNNEFFFETSILESEEE